MSAEEKPKELFKIVNWSTLSEYGSGMHEMARELSDAENLVPGVESGVCCTMNREPMVLHQGKFVKATDHPELVQGARYITKSWDWAKDADVNVIHSHIPIDFPKMKNRVLVAHGTPEHCLHNELNSRNTPLSTTIDSIMECELTVTLIKRHLQYWREYAPAKVYFAPGGVDLSRYLPVPTPGMDKDPYPFTGRPAVMYAEQWRDIKLPFTLFHAAKFAWRRLPALRLEVMNLPLGRSATNPARQLGFFWQKMVAKLNADMICEIFTEARLTQIEKYYRGASMYVSPCWKGDISRCGMEAMATGTPVLALEGPGAASMKCADDPEPMADAIEGLWNRIVADPEKEAAQARLIAEENYDIRDTGKATVAIYKKHFG